MRAVNLIPADQRGSTVGLGRSQGSAYALLLVVAVLALFGYMYGKAQREISSGHRQVATVDAQAQKAEADASSLAGYETLNAIREKRVKAVEELMDARFDWAHVMHEFGRVLPTGVSVSALSGAVGSTATASSSSAASAAKTSTVSSATPAGSIPSFTLKGCAHSEDEVAQALERMRLIDGVKEAALQSATANDATGAASAGEDCPHGISFAAGVVFAPLPASSAFPTAKTVADPAIPNSHASPGSSK